MGEQITIEEFSKVDLRVGVVKSAERIPGTKLLKLIIDLGELGERQIIAGIGDVYSPESLVNRRLIVVANLKPKIIRGYVSQGMILAANCPKGKPRVLTVDDEPEPGAKVC